MKPLDFSAISTGTILGTVATDSSLESAIASAIGAIAVYITTALCRWVSKKLSK